MKISSFFLLIAMLVFLPVAHAADITGIITLKGAPPAETEITPLMDNVDCAAMYKDTPTTHFYVVGPKGELADVVVSLKDITGKSTGASASSAAALIRSSDDGGLRAMKPTDAARPA